MILQNTTQKTKDSATRTLLIVSAMNSGALKRNAVLRF